jgi:flagellar motor switch protein FliN/FliY
MAEEGLSEQLEEQNGAAETPETMEDQIRSMDLLLDIPLVVTVELGGTRMTIKEVLQLHQGSVIELSKLTGEPLEVLVNNKLIARGELVVVNEKFGIRITEILSPKERVRQLR